MKTTKSLINWILILFIFISFQYNNYSKDEWPELFSGKDDNIVFTFDYETSRRTWEETYKLTDIDGLKHSEEALNVLRLWYYRGSGEYRYDDQIAGYLIEAIKKFANQVQNKINNCDDLQKMYGDQIKDRQIKKIAFIKPSGGSAFGSTIRMGYSFIEQMLKEIGTQIKNGATNINIDPSKITYKDLDIVDVFGHEVLHHKTGAGEPANVDECIVHCLTKNCLSKNPDAYKLSDYDVNGVGKLKCNEITEKQWEWAMGRTGDVDPRKDMQAGECFCGEKWTEDAECDKKKKPPKKGGSGGGSGGSSGNGGSGGSGGSSSGSENRTYAVSRGDSADDHYSSASSFHLLVKAIFGGFIHIPLEGVKTYCSFNFYPDILIYDKYLYGDIQFLLENLGFDYMTDYKHDFFSNHHKILVIPSGELIGDSSSEVIKQALQLFVERGGVILCLAQQYDADWSLMPVPEGESFMGYGFRQDQSCLKNSVYYTSDIPHPVLSSGDTQLFDMGVDGYFPHYPGNATVLLRRRINQEPAMLFYPYGEGMVIVSSMFTDYAAVRSMASVSEKRVFRDLLTFAKNPHLEIPVFQFNKNSSFNVTLHIGVSNFSDKLSAKAKLMVYTPDRDMLLHQIEVGATLAPGGTIQIPLSFTLSELDAKYFGIAHVDYLLYDGEDNIIQAPQESPSGRFAINKITEDANITGGLFQWIVLKDEVVFQGEPVDFTLMFKNTSSEPKTLSIQNPFVVIGHGGADFFFPSFDVQLEPGERYEHHVSIPSEHFSTYMNNVKITTRFQYHDEQGALKQIGAAKTFFLKSALTESSVDITSKKALPPGSPVAFTLQSKAKENIPGQSQIQLLLGQNIEENSGYTFKEIKTIFESSHDFSINGEFLYNGSYTPSPDEIHPSGNYQLKLSVTAPNGARERDRRVDFSYLKSIVDVKLNLLSYSNGINCTSLEAGETYQITGEMGNRYADSYQVKDGKLTLRLISPSNQEVFRKELTSLTISSDQKIDILETFVFNPVENGNYSFEYAYIDETTPNYTTAELNFKKLNTYSYGTYLTLSPDKIRYQYMDTANIAIKIKGMGNYTLQLLCPETGLQESRSISIPESSPETTGLLQIPIGMESAYTVIVSIKDATGIGFQRHCKLPVEPLCLDYSGQFSDPLARVGFPYGFQMKIKKISGFSIPIQGQLRMESPDLQINEYRTIAIDPSIENNINQSFTMYPHYTPGSYPLTVTLSVNGIEYIKKTHTIQLLPAKIDFPPLAKDQYNANETISISAENIGGFPQEFTFEFKLLDSLGHQCAQLTESQSLAASAKQTFSLAIPDTALSGDYYLFQKATHSETQKIFENQSPLKILGQSAGLNTYTLKKKYLDSETITGKAEITADKKDLSLSKLTAEIIKLEHSQVKKINNTVNCMVFDSQNHLWVGTDMGISVYDGNNWQDYRHLTNGDPIEGITAIASGPNNTIYGLTYNGIVEIRSNQIQLIPHMRQYFNEEVLAVDQSARIWMSYMGEMDELAYYHNNSWHVFNGDNPQCILCNKKGGVWIIDEKSITYVTANLTSNTWDSSSSANFPANDFYSIAVDQTGKLWITTQSTYELYTFTHSGSPQWTNLSHSIGFPENGMEAITIDENNTVFGIGVNTDRKRVVYQLENEIFIHGQDNIYMNTIGILPDLAASAGFVYTNARYMPPGSNESDAINGLLQLSLNSGVNEISVWTQEYQPPEIPAHSTHTIELNTGQALPPGSYILRSQLISKLPQRMADSSYPFTVRDSDVSVSLLTDSMENGFIKTNTDNPITLEIFNNTPEEKTDLLLTVKIISPLGNEETLLSETLNLPPNHLETRSFNFNEPNQGTWKINAILTSMPSATRGALFEKTAPLDPLQKLLVNNATDSISTTQNTPNRLPAPQGPQKLLVNNATDSISTTQNTPNRLPAPQGSQKLLVNESNQTALLSESELLLRVTPFMVSTEIIAPDYAGDNPFQFKLLLNNNGYINANINVLCQSSDTSSTTEPIELLNEPIRLLPLEKRLITITDSLNNFSAKTFAITLSGDVTNTLSHIVQYAYGETFDITPLPQYREGLISIPFSLSHPSGLPFTDNLRAEIFPIGATIPLISINHNYSLDPSDSPLNDSLVFYLEPGNYELKIKTSKGSPDSQDFLEFSNQVFPLSVLPSGLGSISIAPETTTPTGSIQIPYSISNTDTCAGLIPITITLNNNQTGTTLLTETVSYFLDANESQGDMLHLNINTLGNYTLFFTGPKIAAPITSLIKVVNHQDIIANLSILNLEPGADQITVQTIINNNGFQSFTGSLVIELEDFRQEQSIQVSNGGNFTGEIGINTNLLSPGQKEIKAFLYDAANNVIAETSGTTEIKNPDIKIIHHPENLEISAGSFGEINLTLKNEGNLRGEALLKLNAFDTFYQEIQLTLEPGEEILLDEMQIEAPLDLPDGLYPLSYKLTGTGVHNGILTGNFTFKVMGLALEVEASFDRSLYNPGETATLTLNITSHSPSDAPLEAMINWGNFSETRNFNLSSGSTSLAFDIPLEEERGDKVFYGIYFAGGKGIHLNDIYLNFKGTISVELDQQVYAPGEVVHAFFTGDQPGILEVSSFDEKYTVNLSSTGSASFQIPYDCLGGTYGVNWHFTATDPDQSNVSGSKAFDVSGLMIKVAQSDLEKDNYSPGETLNTHYIFESNQDQSLELHSWVIYPSGTWDYLGENQVVLSSTHQVDVNTSYSLATNEAGIHSQVYGLYLPGSTGSNGCTSGDCDQLVLSGSTRFDVGNAVLLNISTDQTEYKIGNEPVNLKLDYFGQGNAQMKILMNDEEFGQQSIQLNGMGSSEIILDSSQFSGGGHIVQVALSQNGLTSFQTTSFVYGTDLPDLVIQSVEEQQDGLQYKFKVWVVNNGNTPSALTTIIFKDNDEVIGTASIPSLSKVFAGVEGAVFSKSAPSPPEAHEIIFTWNGTGKAGVHELSFEVDSSHAVKEFSEFNNIYQMTLEVPELFYNLKLEPLNYPANTTVPILTQIINNQNTPLSLVLDLSIINEDTGLVIYQSQKNEEFPGLGRKNISDTFNTETHPAGTYGLKQIISTGTETISRTVSFYIEPTRSVSGTLQISPQQIPANTPTDIQLEITLKNTGNVNLEEESLQVEIFNKDLGDTVQSVDTSVSIPLGEEITESQSLSLSLSEGNYEICLKHKTEIIALADLTAFSAIKPKINIAVHPRVLLISTLPLASRGALFEKTAPLHPPQKLLVNDDFNSELSDQNTSNRLPAPQSPQKLLVNDDPSFNSNISFFTNLLQSHSIQYEMAYGFMDSFIKFHKNQANINILLGNTINRNFLNELKERVWYGESLILICDTPIQNPQWKNFLGVQIKPLPGQKKETKIKLLPNPFGNESDIELSKKLKLQLLIKLPDVQIIAQTKQNKIPAMTYRKYGNGHILVTTLPLSFRSGSEFISNLLLNAINKFNHDIYSSSTLTRILPIEITIDNNSSIDKNVILKEKLPQGVIGFDFNPMPEQGEELKWNLSVPSASSSKITSWLKLPDQINLFDVKIELYNQEKRLNEEILELEVTNTVLMALNELILDLESKETNNKEKQMIKKTVAHLEKIRRRTGENLMIHIMNLQNSIRAGELLSKVKSINVSTERQKIQEIIKISGRKLYEGIKTWGENQLRPLLNLIK